MRLFLLATVMFVSIASCDLQKSGGSDGLTYSVVKLDGRMPIEQASLADARYIVTSTEVTVPETLRVSEGNSFRPNADIVWRGDPLGNRYAQVKSIVEEGLKAGTETLKSGPEAVLLVQMERFHALTEKARYTIGGVHDLIFVLTVKDAKTDAVLEGPRRVEVAIRASGTSAAIAEDAAGQTQRVVIVAGLAEAIRQELSGALPAQ